MMASQAAWRVALGVSLCVTVPPAASADTSPQIKPRLVLVIAVDQLRRDRLTTDLPGGLGRLVREGRVFSNSTVAHAITDTCPGHAVLVTGRHPGPSGIPANRYIDRATGERRYCIEDPEPDAAVFGSDDRRSPRNLRVSALGDWMKSENPATRVFSVSGKDRAAVTLGGQHPDAAYWYQREGRVGFTTSRYYANALPAWVSAWRRTTAADGEQSPAAGIFAGIPDRWEHATEKVGSLRVDDYIEESSARERTSGHPLRSANPETFAENIYYSPFVDDLTLDFARELVAREKLGSGSTPDLLAISLSGTDLVGHSYGPESLEAEDALARLDASLGDFLDFLFERFGQKDVLIALSADHGVLPLPGWLAGTGRGSCPVESGREGVALLAVRLYWALHSELGPSLSIPRQWLDISGYQLTVDRRIAEELDVPVEKVIAVAKRELESEPIIAHVWTRDEVLNGDSETARRFRHSFDPEKSGDLMIEVAPGCLLTPFSSGTTHGSPHAYDRDVPLVLFGAGIEAGRIDDVARTVDLAPTLAALLGVAMPDDLDGRPLVEVESQASPELVREAR